VGVAGTDLCRTSRFAEVGGEASDPGECVCRGAAAGCGVSSDAAGVGEPVGYEAGDGRLGGAKVREGQGRGEMKYEFASSALPEAVR